MTKVKLGVIGLGAIGTRIMKGIADSYSDSIDIVAVCDANPELLNTVAKEFSIPQSLTNHKELLIVDLDIVYIAVPPKYHESVALDVMASGKHILCEKPLANSLHEAKAMVNAINNTDQIGMMNFPLNYQPQMYKMKQLIEEGYIGKMRRIDLILHFPEWPRVWQKNSWVGNREQGGYILEVGAHWIQFIQKNFGTIEFIQGEVHYPEDETLCETSVKANMTLHNGIQVHVDGISQIPGKERVELIIHGTEGSVMIENWGTLKAGKAGQPYELISTEDIKIGKLFDNMILALQGKEADLYDFTVGYNVQVVLEAFKDENLVKGITLTNLYM